MADILIRGMEMPKDCLYCHFVSYDNDHCVVMDKDIPISGTKPSWCPILSLPEGHGELIDKAEAYDRIAEQEGGNYIDMDSVGKGLEECQTIVPAEGGGEDGN